MYFVEMAKVFTSFIFLLMWMFGKRFLKLRMLSLTILHLNFMPRSCGNQANFFNSDFESLLSNLGKPARQWL
jgi:hypothetical protein